MSCYRTVVAVVLEWSGVVILENSCVGGVALSRVVMEENSCVCGVELSRVVMEK